MNIALLANLMAKEPLERLQRWWTGSRFAPCAPKAPLDSMASRRPGVGSGKCHGAMTRERPVFGPRVVPLRVVRVAETGLHRSSVGRMVISGRMADVCAELDRLVARESEQLLGAEVAR